MPLAETLDEGDEGNLRGIGDAAEHRFAEEGPADGNAVEPSDEFAIPPGLDRMGVAEFEELLVARHDLAADPGGATVGAAGHHFGKGRIDPHLERIAAQGPLQTVGNVEFIERQDPAGIRGEPADLAAVVHRHRKHAATIGRDEHRGPDITFPREDRFGHPLKRDQIRIAPDF